MIKVEVIEDFTLKEFEKIQNLTRAAKNKEGSLFVGDTFECDKEMAEYLTGNNPKKAVVVKVIEVKPEKKEVKKEEPISEELERKVKEQQEKIEEITKEKPKKKKKRA